MAVHFDPKYDEPGKWVQHKREADEPWDWERIRSLNGKSEDKVIEELQRRHEDDDWPSMDLNDWYEFIKAKMDAEKEQLPISLGHDGALYDPSQDNNLKIPENPRSSWQLYKNKLTWNEASVNELEKATHGILRRLNNDTRETGPVKGLVLGYVQSGKTANMEALMAMAADHGWNMFIILSGTIENLRLQTLRRMHRDLNNEGNLSWYGLEHLSKNSPVSQRPQDLHFGDNAQSRYFTVCLKNKSRLQNLLDWIHADKNAHDLMRILIIDDEADQASISNTAVEYGREENERKGINKLIVDLVQDQHYKGPKKRKGHAKAINYVMYTATPYANFLNESTPESLYPSDFIWTLKASPEYIGAKKIFGYAKSEEASDGLDIKRFVDQEDLKVIADLYDNKSDRLPASLEDALHWFICCVAVMRLWDYKKPISMLIHTSQKQSAHSEVANAVDKWLKEQFSDIETLLEDCRIIYEQETERITKEQWLEQFEDYGVPADNVRDYPSFSELRELIEEIAIGGVSPIKLSDEGDLQYHQGLHLVIDNCSKNGITADNEHIRLAYPEETTDPYPSPAPAFVIIGGSTLSRGLTIEGLVSTFFLRSSCQADSLMQMGRWFGFRRGYELLPRLWMTDDTINKFRFLTELEEDLRGDLRKYMLDISPRDYGPHVKNSPKVSWLRVTSRKHMTNAQEADMDYTGAKPQTSIFDNNEAVQKENVRITEEFLNSLEGKWELSYDKSSVFMRNVALQTIMDNFLIDKFSFSNRSRVFNEMESFCAWIKEVSDEQQLSDWTVIVAGKGLVTEGASLEKTWKAGPYNVGIVNRSRRKHDGDMDDTIDIGVLRSIKDLVADVPGETVKSVLNGQNLTTQKQVDDIRKRAELDNTPLLVLYRIDKKSTVQNASERSSRVPLDLNTDLIGVQVCVPGIQKGRSFSKTLTVTLPEKSEEEKEEEL